MFAIAAGTEADASPVSDIAAREVGVRPGSELRAATALPADSLAGVAADKEHCLALVREKEKECESPEVARHPECARRPRFSA